MRAGPVEQIVARICREAGARVQTEVRLHDFISTRAGDERRIDVLASGLPCFGGSQLIIDATLRSTLTRDGEPRARSMWQDGAVLIDARRDKERSYPELVACNRGRFVVLALDIGGRFSEETADFLKQLAWARARASPSYLQKATAHAFERRWSRMLAVTASSSFAASLLLPKASLRCENAADAASSWLGDVLAEARHL